MVSTDWTLLLFLIGLGVTAVSVFRWRQRAVLPLAIAGAVVLAVYIWRGIEANAPGVADAARYLASEPVLWLVLLFIVAAQTWMAPILTKAKGTASSQPASSADVAVLGQAVTEALAAQQKQIAELAAQVEQQIPPAPPANGSNGGAHVPF